MKDKNNLQIKVGDLVKKCGDVQYADAKRYKISRKTWQVSAITGNELYYNDGIQDSRIPRAKGIDYLVVGDEKGYAPEYAPVTKVIAVTAGAVGGNYEVLKDIKEQNWKKGDIVKIHGTVSFDTLEKGFLKQVDDSIKNKHTLVVVDTIKAGLSNK